MKAIAIQVQPDRSIGLDIEKLKTAFQALASRTDLISEQVIDASDAGEPYINVTFETHDTGALWDYIWKKMYMSPEFGLHMAYASMAVSANINDWSNYNQLYHYETVTSPNGVAH